MHHSTTDGGYVMLKRTLALLGAGALITTATIGQTTTLDIRKSAESNTGYIATNGGIFGLNPTTNKAGFTFPADSGNPYLLGSGSMV